MELFDSGQKTEMGTEIKQVEGQEGKWVPKWPAGVEDML